MEIVYQNNDVEITIEIIDEYEAMVNVNGGNLIWISQAEAENFKSELSALLDRYRI